MLESAADVALSFADRYGAVVLLVAFALEGALIGKLLPTRTLLVAVVLAAGTSLLDYAAVFAAAVVGATVGQVVLFLAVRRLEFDPASHDRIPLGDAQVSRAERWFDRWGPAAIAVTNTLPVTRGSLTVPTAMGRVPISRFTTYSLVGTSCYVGALVAVAFGIDGALSADLATVALATETAESLVARLAS